MTLQEKLASCFKEYLITKSENIRLEVVSEEFAINFANWYEFALRESDNLNERFTPKQLIEMFKKEKGL